MDNASRIKAEAAARKEAKRLAEEKALAEVDHEAANSNSTQASAGCFEVIRNDDECSCMDRD